jgi:mycofactocin precursor
MTATEPTAKRTADTPVDAEQLPAEGDEVVVEDVLVEEISIDGMCGVY